MPRTTEDAGFQPTSTSKDTLLDFAVSHAPAVFYIANIAGDRPLTFISSNVEDILGHSHAAFVKDPMLGRELFHPEDHPLYTNRIDNLATLGRASLEYRFLHGDGSYRWIKDNLRYVEGNGKAEFVGCMIDITAQKETEGRLATAEVEQRRLMQLIQDAIESVPHGFSITDTEPKIALCNSAYASALGLKTEDVVGMSSREGIRRFLEIGRSYDGKLFADNADIEEELDARFKQASQHPLEMEVELKDGTWWLLTCNRITDGGYVTVRTDITRQKQAEAAMRESRERIHRVLEACPLPVNVTRMDDGTVLYESPASKVLFARENLTEPARSIDIYADPADREEYVRQLRKYGAVDGMEFRLRRMNGEFFWGSVSAKRIELDGVDCIVSSTWDMTGDLALEEELSRQREALHQSEKLSALGEMLAGVAHELNNPLSVLVGQALLLKETATDDQIAGRADKIGNAADRCARIVKTFLAMARQQPLKRRNTEVNDMIDAALEITAYGVRAAGITVTTRLGQNLPTVWIDPDQVNQVLTNLILNAKHVLENHDGEKRLHISSSYRKKGNEVVIKVRDTGPGIAPEIRSRVFEPFFTTKEVGAGTGIGLAFCHRIMEFHGGRIKLESTPGDGAAFMLRIPVSSPGATLPQSSDSGVDRPAYLKVLVVDDEEDVTEILNEILTRDGHRVYLAATYGRALEMIVHEDFDIILSSIKPSEPDGTSLYHRLEDKHPHLMERIGFIAGNTMSAEMTGILATSGRPHLEKPITPGEVRDIVSKLINPQPVLDQSD